MSYPPPKSASSVAAELSSNQEWDYVDNLLPRASVVPSSSPPSSKREPLHHRQDDQPISTYQPPPAAASTLPLDDFLSGKQDKKFPFGFTLSVPCSSKLDQKHHVLEEDAESSSCSGESAVSELTLMTYRAELMKEVSFVQ